MYVPGHDFRVLKHLRCVDHLTIMYWKLFVITLAVACEICLVLFLIVDSDLQALLVVVSATPLADWPTGGAPPPLADDVSLLKLYQLFKYVDPEIQTASGSDPRPSHPGNERSLCCALC